MMSSSFLGFSLSFLYFSLFIVICFSDDDISSSVPFAVAGDDAVANGKFRLAVDHYSRAIDESPTYQLYYKRGIAYLGFGKRSLALDDLTAAVELDSEYPVAHFQRASIYTSLGLLESAINDYNRVVVLEGRGGTHVKQSQEKIKEIRRAVTNVRKARNLVKDGKWSSATSILTELVAFSPHSGELRRLRILCSKSLHNWDSAISDLGSLIKLNPQDVSQLYMERAQMLLQVGEYDSALSHVKLCLKQDPENRSCKTLFKTLKKALRLLESMKQHASSGDWDAVISESTEILELPPDVVVEKSKMWVEVLSAQCQALSEGRKWSQCVDKCSLLLQQDGDNVDALQWRLKAFEALEDWDNALRDAQRLRELKPRDPNVGQQWRNINRKSNMKNRKDLYKMLGVSKDATERQIKKAYRTVAKEKHPDRCPTERKAQCEVEFKDITEAFEILTDEEKRARYDSGEDLDGNGGGGFGFPGGFEHFASPFSFNFGNQGGGHARQRGGGGGGTGKQFNFGGFSFKFGGG